MTKGLEKCLIPRSLKFPQVIYSKCQDIFYNLALEDWIYNNVKFDDSSECRSHAELLMVWRNRPCIVLGRHQNAWVETDVAEARKVGIPLARRRSGGGCVYHDLGNINLTFFTSKKFYNRKRNLHFISNHLRDAWDLDARVNNRDDMVLKDTYKVSGTAAKLGGDVAYHHFTLLVSAKLENARRLLTVSKAIKISHHANCHLIESQDGMVTKATASTPSSITNLCHHHPSITTDALIDSLIQKYSHPGQKLEHVTVDPQEMASFEGIEGMVRELKSWQWVYGHSPPFKITHSVSLPGRNQGVEVCIEVEKGVVRDVVVVGGEGKLYGRVAERLRGLKLCSGDISMPDGDDDDDDNVTTIQKSIIKRLSSFC